MTAQEFQTKINAVLDEAAKEGTADPKKALPMVVIAGILECTKTDVLYNAFRQSERNEMAAMMEAMKAGKAPVDMPDPVSDKTKEN